MYGPGVSAVPVPAFYGQGATMMAGSGEFLKIPKALREMRRVSWPAKAVACHLRFRQADKDSISRGIRLLSRELGMAFNTVRRAIGEASAKGLLRVLNPDAPRGTRGVYDARPLDTLPSDSTPDTLSGQTGCTNPCVSSDSRADTDGRTNPGVTGDSIPEPREKSLKKNSALKEQEREDFERILSLAFPGGATNKQRVAMKTTIQTARRQGVPLPFVAHALISRRQDLPAAPWKRADKAIETAAQFIHALNIHEGRQRWTDLQQVVQAASEGQGGEFPRNVDLPGGPRSFAATLRLAAKWPQEAQP